MWGRMGLGATLGTTGGVAMGQGRPREERGQRGQGWDPQRWQGSEGKGSWTQGGQGGFAQLRCQEPGPPRTEGGWWREARGGARGPLLTMARPRLLARLSCSQTLR